MIDLKSNEIVMNIFNRDRKCIINTDLDGILSGMLLQYFLNWKVVGYSSCCGKIDDELWLEDENENLSECVFIDLPVCVSNISTIDQHFVAFDEDSLVKYSLNKNKINPNIIRKRVFKDSKNNCHYTAKYPFGTVHFILAVLENLNIIDDSFIIDFNKKLGDFDLADLILRADRVIGNTFSYTQNCIDWANWIINIGGKNTKNLFETVKNQYSSRRVSESNIENMLKSLGCIGIDGDCSNMFRNKDYDLIQQYFNYLETTTNFKSLPIFQINDFNRLKGKRFDVTGCNYEKVKMESLKPNVFSFAFVNMKLLSLTYIEEEMNE